MLFTSRIPTLSDLFVGIILGYTFRCGRFCSDSILNRFDFTPSQTASTLIKSRRSRFCSDSILNRFDSEPINSLF